MISVIIPTYNEAENIASTIAHVRNGLDSSDEIIVSDGGSTDNTIKIAGDLKVRVISHAKGRARQMNAGALAANGSILYFLHADSIPPANFGDQIKEEIHQGYIAGCYRLKFDHEHWFLKVNAWFTRFDVDSVRFGDQSLFITKEVFLKIEGFREDLLMMEDQEIIRRIKKNGKFIVLSQEVITSARKYHDNGIYRMQGIFFVIWALYYAGVSQDKLLRLHRNLIAKHKL